MINAKECKYLVHTQKNNFPNFCLNVSNMYAKLTDEVMKHFFPSACHIFVKRMSLALITWKKKKKPIECGIRISNEYFKH